MFVGRFGYGRVVGADRANELEETAANAQWHDSPIHSGTNQCP